MDRAMNRGAAVVLPLIEVGLIAYATYGLVYSVGIVYLMKPETSWNVERRRSTGVGIIAVYFVLFAPMAMSFMRLLQVVWTNPGVVPLGDPTSEKKGLSTKQFDRYDAYTCEYDGLPRWCHDCHNFKPDRSHHSSDLGRCVRRMDHFCPYAGGMIGETSHKFFIQFLFYAAVYTGYVLIVMAIFLADRIQKIGSHPGVWIGVVACAGLFFLFTAGMFLTTMYHLSKNLTTVETLNRANVTTIAMRGTTPAPSTVTTPIITEVQRTNSRSYVVVQTQPGENPWDMGPLANIKSIMGNSLFDWLIPLRMSPCIQRSEAGEYEWGIAVQKLMRDNGIGSAYRSRRRRSSHRSSRG